MLPRELLEVFEGVSLAGVQSLKEDVLFAVPQLQALIKQKDIEDLSSKLLTIVHEKVVNATAAKKKDYLSFFTHEYKSGDAASKRKKDQLLSNLRRAVKDAQSSISWLTQTLGNIVSSQNTSTKKHDLKRMIRQNAIRNNVDAVKSMDFDSLAEFLEEYADEMGVLLVNVDTESYHQLLSNRDFVMVNASRSCTLDSRVLHLEGLDVGIVLEQSQTQHDGPLVSQLGPRQPILALPYLTEQDDTGSMLAWVCWDEFVNLEDPSTVTWIEKCNEPHIAALRITMRGTLSYAVSSRDHSMTPASEETGQLMGFLLMASMDKLAKMRTTVPKPSIKATDTITKLMRGLLPFNEMPRIRGNRRIFMGIKGDAEQWRMPWQVGNGIYGTLAPMDVDMLTKVLDGTAPPAEDIFSTSTAVTVNEEEPETDRWKQFEKLVRPEFLKRVQLVSSPDEVCDMLKLPKSMMTTIISAIAPDFEVERLPDTFRECVLGLLENPNQETAMPTKQFFKQLAIDGV